MEASQQSQTSSRSNPLPPCEYGTVEEEPHILLWFPIYDSAKLKLCNHCGVNNTPLAEDCVANKANFKALKQFAGELQQADFDRWMAKCRTAHKK